MRQMEVVSHATPHPPTSSTSSKTNWNASTSTLTHERRCWPEDSHWRPTHWFLAHFCSPLPDRPAPLCAVRSHPTVHPQVLSPYYCSPRSIPWPLPHWNQYIYQHMRHHSSIRSASERANTHSFEDDLLLLQQNISSFEYCGGGREQQTWWAEKKRFRLFSHLFLYTKSYSQKPLWAANPLKSFKNNQNPNVTL